MTMNVATAAAAYKPRAAGHANRSHHEDAGRAGQPADPAAVVQDQARAQKADALHDVRGHAPLVRVGVASQHRRQQREKRAAHADQQIGAHPGGLAIELPLQPYRSAQQTGDQQAADGAVHHHHLLQPVKDEGLRELFRCNVHCLSLPDAITAPPGLLRLLALHEQQAYRRRKAFPMALCPSKSGEPSSVPRDAPLPRGRSRRRRRPARWPRGRPARPARRR